MKFSDYVKVAACCILALGIGMVMAIPLLVKLELTFAIIDFLGRH